MDDTLAQFRQAADQENQHRRARRRYSAGLRQRAVEYCRQRTGADGLRTIAATLGVSVTTLQRWTRAAGPRQLRPVTVVTAPRGAEAPAVAVVITAAGPRIEGLTVESAARLLTLLR
jgi:transposase-like protein